MCFDVVLIVLESLLGMSGEAAWKVTKHKVRQIRERGGKGGGEQVREGSSKGGGRKGEEENRKTETVLYLDCLLL